MLAQLIIVLIHRPDTHQWEITLCNNVIAHTVCHLMLQNVFKHHDNNQCHMFKLTPMYLHGLEGKSLSAVISMGYVLAS